MYGRSSFPASPYAQYYIWIIPNKNFEKKKEDVVGLWISQDFF